MHAASKRQTQLFLSEGNILEDQSCTSENLGSSAPPTLWLHCIVFASATKDLLIISRPSSTLAAIPPQPPLGHRLGFIVCPAKPRACLLQIHDRPSPSKLTKPQESKMALIISGKTSEADTKPRIRVESTVVDVLHGCHRIHTNRWPWTRWVRRLAGCKLKRLARSPMFLVCLSFHTLSVVSLKAHCVAAVTAVI